MIHKCKEYKKHDYIYGLEIHDDGHAEADGEWGLTAYQFNFCPFCGMRLGKEESEDGTK